MDYDKDIRIDETALDVEWLNQPALMLKYAKHAASMRLELDKAKEALDSMRADIDRKIREHPDEFGIIS